ncbi:hypothetical protein OD91_1544 [Lutibacter sp. Hel_I_33_5]|uniref:hypothetical protein n=1 Tax=Lutibacter sp. Hel_I_33_5 TaxID=1566289 RepID=UPI00119E98BE|nr:hypothetical protein [Lutibacter sp. Hel_I_33_5]TVZ56262.1 hypothetical protein OD91_1544 [Lutibacter sp. Hel_I_33_5]
MNYRNLQKSIGFLSLFTLLVFTSCQNNDDLALDTPTSISEDEATNLILADDISEDVDDLVESDETGTFANGRVAASSETKCGTRTKEDTANGKIVTIDFGDGCERKNGKEFSGKIIITYVKADDSFSKTVTFENFAVDGNPVTGSKSITKVKENANGNPEKTHTTDITVTVEDGVNIVKKGTKVKEKTAGADTKDIEDDVYSISGSWESVNKEGVAKTATITTNLRREGTCKHIVSGVIAITKDGASFTLDFGDGTCDNIATLTDADGNVEEITLKERKRKKRKKS